MARKCSRNGCEENAVSTLTFSYKDSQAVLGPLADHSGGGGYDLCPAHAESFTVPTGWEMVRLEGVSELPAPDEDDLLALANAVREIGLRGEETMPVHVPDESGIVELAHRGHLRVIADSHSD